MLATFSPAIRAFTPVFDGLGGKGKSRRHAEDVHV
jgi:hypothetical protein